MRTNALTRPLLACVIGWCLSAPRVSVRVGVAAEPVAPLVPLAGRYILDDSQGQFTARTYNSGLLKHYAHNHIFAVRRFSGDVRFDPAAPEPASLQISIDAASLESVDDLDARSRQTINNMLHQETLQVARYPRIEFRSTAVTTTPAGPADHYRADLTGDLTLHGVTHPASIAADVTVSGHWLHARGELAVRQTDYNMKPETLIGGLIRVNDEVRLVFDLAAYQPVQLTGTVMRYFADRGGFATAVQLQAADGATRMIRFHPHLGAQLTAPYPVGSEAVLWTRESPTPAEPQWNLIGWGREVPVRGFEAPYLESDLKWLMAQPWVTAGAGQVTLSGRLRRVVTSDSGEILALVVAGPAQDTLVLVPYGMRHGLAAPDTERVVPLFAGAQIEATGLPVAARYGTASVYSSRLAASAIVVNGRSAGTLGLAERWQPPTAPYQPM